MVLINRHIASLCSLGYRFTDYLTYKETFIVEKHAVLATWQPQTSDIYHVSSLHQETTLRGFLVPSGFPVMLGQ